MEATFIIKQSELNKDFLDALKSLFRHKKQLQVTVTVAEDFDLLTEESPIQYNIRLEQCLKEMKDDKNTISLTETQLDEMAMRL